MILWMGIDEGSKVTVIAIGSFWELLLNTMARNIKPILAAAVEQKENIKVLNRVNIIDYVTG